MFGRENSSAFGHVCTGGGATIQNSPINITLNINIIQADEEKVSSLVGRIMNMIGMPYGYKPQRLATIENAQNLSGDELQGRIGRAVQGG